MPMTAKRKKQYRLTTDVERCKGCGLCVAFCPRDVAVVSGERINAKGYPVVEIVRPENCIGCRNCVLVCPDCAIEIYEISDDNGDPQ
jgi:2-oxoglutarate ferredoxin oxidoreductase subunit delta